MIILIATLLLGRVASPVTAKDSLMHEQAIAQQFENRVHFHSLRFQPKPPMIVIDTQPTISSFDGSTIREARFDELPPPIQGIFNQWATYTTDQPSGKALFDFMFYRFFFVHELGHWVNGQVMMNRHDTLKPVAARNMDENHWEVELECNRISVAWWRERDPAYLAALIADFRSIESRLPNPVPSGQDKQTYFAANYKKLGSDPQVYGWFLLQSVINAYDEPPTSFQQIIESLPTLTFK